MDIWVVLVKNNNIKQKKTNIIDNYYIYKC